MIAAERMTSRDEPKKNEERENIVVTQGTDLSTGGGRKLQSSNGEGTIHIGISRQKDLLALI